jgi:hypothetical protein
MASARNSLGAESFIKPFLPDRRSFLKGSAALTAGFSTLLGELSLPETAHADDSSLNLLGPRPGYSPQVGTFVSLLTWMRDANGVIAATKGLTQADLDYLIDPRANTIGALMLHLAATETYYQLNTFEGRKWDSWPDSVKQQWDAAMNLGDAGRKTIKGHDRDYYLNILHEARAKTLAEISASTTTLGFWRQTKTGRGGRPTTTASGSTSASMRRITAGKSHS